MEPPKKVESLIRIVSVQSSVGNKGEQRSDRSPNRSRNVTSFFMMLLQICRELLKPFIRRSLNADGASGMIFKSSVVQNMKVHYKASLNVSLELWKPELFGRIISYMV